MATKAKSTTKKSRATKTTPKKTVTKKTSEPKVTRVAVARTTSARSWTSWLTSREPVFTPKTALGSLLAELVGTFVLASLFLIGKGNLLYILFGLVGIVYATWRLSGAHLNPAISVAAWATRNMSLMRTVGYIVAQVLGAMLALLVAHALLPMQPEDASATLQGGAAASVYQAQALTAGKEWYIFFAQMLGAAFFGYIFASVWDRRKDLSSSTMTVSFGFFLALVLATPFAVVNPAVAVAVDGIKWTFWPLAVYIVAPVVGALVGAFLHKLFATDVENVEATSSATSTDE